ncbi:MAG: hypothetical protein ACK5LK_07605, partial [Chthoniobacterales bacterium]
AHWRLRYAFLIFLIILLSSPSRKMHLRGIRGSLKNFRAPLETRFLLSALFMVKNNLGLMRMAFLRLAWSCGDGLA